MEARVGQGDPEGVGTRFVAEGLVQGRVPFSSTRHHTINTRGTVRRCCSKSM